MTDSLPLVPSVSVTPLNKLVLYYICRDIFVFCFFKALFNLFDRLVE